MTDGIEEQFPEIIEKKIAFIVDGIVLEVLFTNEMLAAVFLSQPLILDVTENHEDLRAMIGNVYDESTQKFRTPCPYPSYIFNEETNGWSAPVEYPDDEKEYIWKEDTLSWELKSE
jgi:hypothetical protein